MFKLTSKEKEALKLIAIEEAKNTKTSKARAEEMKRLFANRCSDTCGWFGRLVEVSNHTKTSRMVKVARQGKNDTVVKLEVNGKVKYIPAEVKTNGGRIGSLLDAKAPMFVVYSMNICNSATTNMVRKIKPKVMLTSDFIEVLKACNAIKNTNGNNPEPAIQVSSKKMYYQLLEATNFEADKVYKLEDIVLK